MNAKIKLLADQCTENVDDGGYGYDVFDKEKFAELIVRECMEHAEEIGRLNHGQGSWRAVYDRIRIKMLGEEL